jgi:hypothetical protein
MILKEEVRDGRTTNRTAIIAPKGPSIFGRDRQRYLVTLTDTGKLIQRTFTEPARNLTEARKIAREWCV